MFIKGMEGGGLGHPLHCSCAVAMPEPALELNYTVVFREDKPGLE